MSFGENITVQIFPNEYIREMSLNNDMGINKMMSDGLELNAEPLTVLECRSISPNSSSSYGINAFLIRFDKAANIYPGMILEISNSDEPILNSRWRVSATSPDRKTLFFRNKSANGTFPFSNNGNITIGSNVTFRIPPLGLTKETPNNFKIESYRNNTASIRFNIFNTSLIHPLRHELNNISNNFSLIGTKYGFLIAYQVIKFNKNYNLVSGYFTLRDKTIGIFESYSINPNISGSNAYCFNSNYPIAQGFLAFHETNNIYHTNEPSFIMYSPQVYRNSDIESKDTIFTRPWFLWEQSSSYPIRFPGCISFIAYEKRLEIVGYHANREWNMYTLIKPNEPINRPLIVSLDDQFWRNDYITQEWY